MFFTLVVTLLIAFIINVPIGFALAIAALVSLVASGTAPIGIIPLKMVAGVNSFPLLAIPLFHAGWSDNGARWNFPPYCPSC